MSVQECRVKGYGYKLDSNEQLFSFITNKDAEYDFADAVGMLGNYYNLRDTKSDSRLRLLRIFFTEENSTYVLFVTESSYVQNTHGDNYWVNKYRDDDFMRSNAKRQIETLLQRKLNEPGEIDFIHWQ